MEKIKLIFNLSLKFSQKYFKEYIKLIIKPLIIGIIGICAMLFIKLDPMFAILGVIVTIPCLFFSFWKGFFITYALNAVSYNFLKKREYYSISNCLDTLKSKEKKFAGYISICAILSILAYIPSMHIFIKNIKDINQLLYNPTAILSSTKIIIAVLIINTIILLPFFNFMTQAYYFKKEKENIFSIISNCYRYLDMTGILIITIIYVVNIIISFLNPLIYVPLVIILNLPIYSANTFWYSAKILKKIQ